MSSEPHDVTPEFTDSAETAESGTTRRRLVLSTKAKVILGLVTVLVVVIGYFFLQRFLPEWWARSMANRINGSFASGIGHGLVLGVLGSAIPVILILLALFAIGVGPKNLLSWLLGLVALIFLIPNLLTLGVVLGDGSGALIGQRNLDIFAPGFRGATLIGVILGVVIGVAADFYLLGRRREKRKQVTLKQTPTGDDTAAGA